MKYLGEKIIALILIILLSPLISLSILISFISNRRNPIFQQTRIGKNENPFKIYKITSMRENLNALPDKHVTIKNDPRVTKFGYFIRKTKIDELLQLLNVLKGDMSFVGPRPTVYEDYARMNKYQRQRFSVNPGLTGLAQINGNTELTWPERIELDLAYIKNYSIILDMKIIFKTIYLILFIKAETHPASTDEWRIK